MQGYKPNYLDSVDAILATYSDTLNSLKGRALSESWVIWEANEYTWFSDAPILLIFKNIHLELNFLMLDKLSITTNTLDQTLNPDWYGLDMFDLVWRKDARYDLTEVKGLSLERITVVEYLFQTEAIYNENPKRDGLKHSSWVLNGLGFWFEKGKFLSVYNGLDENALWSDSSETMPPSTSRAQQIKPL